MFFQCRVNTASRAQVYIESERLEESSITPGSCFGQYQTEEEKKTINDKRNIIKGYQRTFAAK
jgi:hypothetical protein